MQWMKWGTVMSKYLFGLLLAGAAAPALAAGPHDHHRGDDNSPRQESRAERPSRGSDQARPQSNRSERSERPQFSGQRPQFSEQRPQFNGQRPQFAGRPQVQMDRPQAQMERPQWNGGDTQRSRPVMRDNPYAQRTDSVRDRRPQEQSRTYYQQRVRTDGTGYIGGREQRVSRYGSRDGYVGSVPRQGTQPALRYQGHRDSVRWNTNWRSDHRYDWRDRRRHHRSLFHIGLYVDPFGWGYQRFNVGWRLYPDYYQQGYWIDPAMYGLPYPPPGLQWVRYWNDALLVDTFTGQIVDQIPGFFW